jgi:hypothetical protein
MVLINSPREHFSNSRTVREKLADVLGVGYVCFHGIWMQQLNDVSKRNLVILFGQGDSSVP